MAGFNLLLLGLMAGVADAAPSNPFRVDSTDASVDMGASGSVDVIVRVPPKHHLYRDMMMVEPKVVRFLASTGAGDPVVIGPDQECHVEIKPASFPPGFSKPDPADPSATREQYDMDVVIRVPFVTGSCFSGAYQVEFLVEYQGCKESLCWMPQTEIVQSTIAISGGGKSSSSRPGPGPAPLEPKNNETGKSK